jgi:transposase-like protein
MTGRNLACDLCVPEDDRALEVFRCIRWSDGVYCPVCKSFEVYNRGYLNKTQIKRYSCKICGKNFTDFTGTVFANKKLPLGEMFYIILNLDKKSIKRLAEELGHKWDSVYRIAHEFRGCLVNESGDPVLSGEIEFDEMYQSAGTKGLKKTSKD